MIIKVRVQTKSSQEKIEEIGVDEYKVWIHDSPHDGRANEAVIESLANYFNIAPSKIHIKSGNKSTNKLIAIDETPQP